MSDDSDAFLSADEGIVTSDVKGGSIHPTCGFSTTSNPLVGGDAVIAVDKGKKQYKKIKKKSKVSKLKTRSCDRVESVKATVANDVELNTFPRYSPTSAVDTLDSNLSSVSCADTVEVSERSPIATDNRPILSVPATPCQSSVSNVSTKRQVVGDSVPEAELITQTTSTIIRGLGDGFTTLTNVFQDVMHINLGENNKSGTHGQKILNGAAKPVTSADEWNSDWGATDGWEVDSPDDLEPNGTSSNQSMHLRSVTAQNHNISPTMNHRQKLDELSNSIEASGWGWSGVTSLAQQFTSSLQSTSLNIVSGGVDVLEMIGRKTMSVLAENDPGYECTKKLLYPHQLQSKSNLSQLLHEAKEKHTARTLETENIFKLKRGDFAFQLEQKRALIHLEALELVGEQAQTLLSVKLDSLTPDSSGIVDKLISPTGWLDSISDILNIETEMNDSRCANLLDENNLVHNMITQRLGNLSEANYKLWFKLIVVVKELSVVYGYERVLNGTISIWNETLNFKSESSAEELYYMAIANLAESTSVYLEYLHKLSECFLARNPVGRRPDVVHLASCLACVSQLVFHLQVALCHEFIKKLKKIPNCHTSSMPVGELSTNLLLDCGGAENYLRNAIRTMIPVLQLACVNSVIS